jgi:hypothetical protein
LQGACLTAREAHALAMERSVEQDAVVRQIVQRIRDAAFAGDMRVEVPGQVDPYVLEYFENMGYRVLWDGRKATVISWEDV